METPGSMATPETIVHSTQFFLLSKTDFSLAMNKCYDLDLPSIKMNCKILGWAHGDEKKFNVHSVSCFSG